jgi:hypothetical protein
MRLPASKSARLRDVGRHVDIVMPLLWSCVPLMALLVPCAAFADTAAELLQRGKDEIQAENVDKACATFSEAEAMAPSVDSIGLIAACHEKQGKLATAHREYLETAERAAKANDDRETAAREFAAALAPKVPRLTINLARGEHPKLTLGGREIDPAGYASPTMIDPGHSVDVEATDPGGKKWHTSVELGPGDSVVVDVPPIATWAGGIAPPQKPIPPPPAKKRYASGPPASALVTGTIGLAGLGVMGGGGIATLILNKQAEEANTKYMCGHVARFGPCAEAAKNRDQAFAAGIAADVGLGVGVVGLVSSAFLWGFHVGAKADDEKAGPVVRSVDLTPLDGGGRVTVRTRF